MLGKQLGGVKAGKRDNTNLRVQANEKDANNLTDIQIDGSGNMPPDVNRPSDLGRDIIQTCNFEGPQRVSKCKSRAKSSSYFVLTAVTGGLIGGLAARLSAEQTDDPSALTKTLAVCGGIVLSQLLTSAVSYCAGYGLFCGDRRPNPAPSPTNDGSDPSHLPTRLPYQVL